MTIPGCDLAWVNDKVDYAAMKVSGIRFACIKIGQGLRPVDVMYKTHRNGCIAQDIPHGVYWFADYTLTGLTNATQLIKLSESDYGQCPPVLDLEFFDGFGPRPDGYHMLKFALDFFDAFEQRAGIIAMFYSNRDVINQMMAAATADQKALLLRHQLWIASDTKKPIYSPWPKFTLNQWELDVVVPWAHGSVDLDEFNGNEADFQAWIGATPVTVPAPLTVEQRLSAVEAQIEAHWGPA
jgi:lysozyme